MLKSIFYKEWIKSRWGLLGTTLIGIAVVLYIFTVVGNKMTVIGAKFYTLKILYDDPQVIYYDHLCYIPLLIALALGLGQYIPEVLHKRIRLTLHLPAPNNRLILYMALYGVVALTVCYGLLIALFLYKNIALFPCELTNPVMVSLLPQFIAGYLAYNFIAMISMEPNMLRQVIYAVVGYVVVSPFYSTVTAHGAHSEMVWLSLLFAVVSFPLVLYSAHRFSKGEI